MSLQKSRNKQKRKVENAGRSETELREIPVDEGVFKLETPGEAIGYKEPNEILSPKSLGFPKDKGEAVKVAAPFVAEQYLGKEFSDEEFTDHMLYELWRRKNKFEEAPKEGISNKIEACKAQKDHVSRVLGWGIGVGVIGSAINYSKVGLPEVEASSKAVTAYGGYSFSVYGIYKGLVADAVTVKDVVNEFSQSFEEQADLYEEAYFEVKEEGHGLEKIDAAHNPILDSQRTGKYRRNYNHWRYDGPDTLYDRVINALSPSL